MHQGVNADELERYHDAPVYQTRRDIARLRRDLESSLSNFLREGRSAEWSSAPIAIPQNFQFFRRNWEDDDATFSWMSYVVEQFMADRVREIVALLEGAGIGRSPLELIKSYFRSEPRSSHIHQSLNVLAEIGNLEIDDSLAALFHHELLNVYSRIAARGAILQHIWEDYISDGDEAPLGYLVQVTRDSMHGGFPDFYSWDVLDFPKPQYCARGLRPQQPILIRANSRMGRTEERELSVFFQNRLYPIFAYPNISLSSPSPTTEGHAQEGIFGFLFVPFYPLHALSEAPEGSSPVRRHFGDWVGVLQIELRTDTEKPRELLAIPAFDLQKLVQFLQIVHSNLDDRVDRLVESSAVRWAESQDRMEDPNELCARSIARSVGWEASLGTVDFDGPVERDAGGPDDDGARFWVQLDWEWPRRRKLQKRAALLVSLRTPTARARRGPRLPMSDAEWRDVLPQAYELCRGIHRSVFTWWHAQRSRRIDISEQLNKVLAQTADWFGGNKQLPNSMPHTLPSLTALVVEQHMAAIRSVFPFLPEAWWCASLRDFEGATGDAVKALHENLKATFGLHACINGGSKALTVGGALVLFMMVLYGEFSANPPKVEIAQAGFGSFRRPSPLLPPQTRNESLEAYESLVALFRDVVKLKDTGGLAVKLVVIDQHGRYFDVILDWDAEDQRRFFRQFSGTRRELLPDGDALGNTVNALWSVIIAGSSGTETVGRPGLVCFSSRPDGFRLRVG